MEKCKIATNLSGESLKENETLPSKIQDHSPSHHIDPTKILTEQILQHYRFICIVENQLKEVLDLQEDCIERLKKENENVSELPNLQSILGKVSFYTLKLNNLRKEMALIQDRVTRLKVRANAIKDNQEQKLRERREVQARHRERERLLTAKPVWEIDHTSDTEDQKT